MASFQVFAQNGKITGSVYDKGSNEPLPFVNIVVNGTTIGTTSNLEGQFSISGVKPGYVKLMVSSIGYEKLLTEEFLVTNANTATIDIKLQSTSLALNEVKIKANTFKFKKESPVSLRTLQLSEIEKNPGSNRDISKVIQSLPGVSSSVSFRNDIIVRGGGANENRFYLDGIEIPNINHFATQGSSGGPVGIINADFIREVDFYSGAFPANRGNALSSVLELRQKDGNKDKMKLRGSLGASEVALTLDGPLSENGTLIFSVRRSYLGFLFNVLGLPFLPTYNDYQYKYKLKIDNKKELIVLGLGALDQFNLNTGLENPDEGQRYILGYLPVNEQWSYTQGFNFKNYREKSFDQIVYSRSMLNNRTYKYDNNIKLDQNLLQNYKSTEGEDKLRYEYEGTFDDLKVSFGAGTEHARYTNSTYQKVFIANELREINYNTELELFKWSVFGQVSNVFLENKLTLSFGLRADANSYSKSMQNLLDQLSPRLSASYLLREKVKINANVGRYYQLPAYTTLGFKDNNNELVNKNNGLLYIQSDHLVAGLEWMPGNESKFTLEGFYKNYKNYPFSVSDSIALANKGGDFGTVGDEEVVSIGQGRAYGFEILGRDKSIKDINIILSYTFVRSEFKDVNGNYISSSWDNKHILNLTAYKSFGKNWDIGLKWRFVGGAPYTPYDMQLSGLRTAWDVRQRGYLDYSKFNEERLPVFHQLDIRIDKEFFFDKWTLMMYLDIQNVYNFKGKQQPILTNLDETGNISINPNNTERYNLREIQSTAGTILPTLGLMIEF